MMSSDYVMAHRETLQAMGLTLYVARRPLPGAAASQNFADVQARSGSTARPLPQGAQPTRRASPAEALVQPRESLAAAAVDAPLAVASPLAPFTVAAVTLGACLWLEELPDGVLGRDQVQLMRAICQAFAWPVEPLTINQFAWPMHRNPQFDQGAEAAMAALSAFVGRQMEAGRSARLILLGSSAQDRLGDVACDAPVFRTESTRDMLANPLLKRDAWRDLRQP